MTNEQNKQNENNAGGELKLDFAAFIANSEGKPTSFEFEDIGRGSLKIVLFDEKGERLDYGVIDTIQRKEAIKELENLGLTYINQFLSRLSNLVANAKDPTSFEIRTEVTTYVIPRNKPEERTSLRIALFDKNINLVRDYNINTGDGEEARAVLKKLGLQDISKPDQELLKIEQDMGDSDNLLKKGGVTQAREFLTRNYGERILDNTYAIKSR